MLKLAVVGDPVDHSLSPRLHTAALEVAGVEGSYVARRVDGAGMRLVVAELRRGELHGANVTMPHKRLAAELADDLGHEAARAGSVNTLSVEDGRVRGDTTDIAGIRLAWGALPDDRVLILGAGGAAAAALLAMEGRQISISARRQPEAAALVDRTGVSASVLAWETAVAGAVILNATPLGMGGEKLPPGLFEEASGLFDMAYASVETPAVRLARRLVLPVVTGMEMLVVQAAVSFEIWTGIRPSLEAMLAAARS